MAVDPMEAADDVTRLFGDRAQSKNLDLASIVRLPPGARASTPIRSASARSCSNLVNNALKFTERGVTVEIEQDGRFSAARVFRLSIRQASAAPKNKLDWHFGAFTQADQSTTRKFGGTGVSIFAIARKLVAAMGGDLRSKFRRRYFSALVNAERRPRRVRQFAGRSFDRAIVCVEGGRHAVSCALSLREAGFFVVAFAERGTRRALAWRAYRFAEADLLANGVRRSPCRPAVARRRCGSRRADRQVGRRRPRELRVAASLSRLEPTRSSPPSSRARKIGDDGEKTGRTCRASPRRACSSSTTVRVNISRGGSLAPASASRPTWRRMAREAVECVERKTTDLVFMDGSMPVMDSYETTRHPRRRTGTSCRAEDRRPLTAHAVVGAGARRPGAEVRHGRTCRLTPWPPMAECLRTHIAATATLLAPADARRRSEPVRRPSRPRARSTLRMASKACAR